MRQARAEKDKSFDGVFYTAVKTTKIFCRPTCPARTPLERNVEYFASPGDALFAGYRPCKRCKPMDRIQKQPEWVGLAMSLVERSLGSGSPRAISGSPLSISGNPLSIFPDGSCRTNGEGAGGGEIRTVGRIDNKTLRQNGLSPERLRRYFKQHYGMTFQAYARGRRLGQAFSRLREGQDVIETAIEHGFESTSGFREAFRSVFGDPPSKANEKAALVMRWIETPLGAMVAVANDEALCLLEFADRRMMRTQLQTLMNRFKCVVLPGQNAILGQIEEELGAYFKGDLKEFKTPLLYPGSAFQIAVWDRLLKIPYGEVLSYSAMAKDLGFEGAQRAVGKANGDNRIAIVIPCHRVIRADGTLCGYGGGLWRKKRLIELESGQGVLA